MADEYPTTAANIAMPMSYVPGCEISQANPRLTPVSGMKVPVKTTMASSEAEINMADSAMRSDLPCGHPMSQE